MKHELQRLSSVRTYGHPHEPCFAVCTCGYFTPECNSLVEVGRHFDDHLRLWGIEPTDRRTPWRENA